MFELGVAIYALVAVVCARLVAGHMAYYWLESHNERWRSLRIKSPNGDQWAGAICLGLLAGAAWPLILIMCGVGRAPLAVGAEKSYKQKVEEKALRKRIKELEEQTGVV